MGTNTTYSELDPAYQGQDLRIGIVMSRFNMDICDGLLSACERELLRLGVSKQNILLVNVPGALEHPLALKKMAPLKAVQFWDMAPVQAIHSDDLVAAACLRLNANFSQAQWSNLFGSEEYRELCPGLPVP